MKYSYARTLFILGLTCGFNFQAMEEKNLAIIPLITQDDRDTRDQVNRFQVPTELFNIIVIKSAPISSASKTSFMNYSLVSHEWNNHMKTFILPAMKINKEYSELYQFLQLSSNIRYHKKGLFFQAADTQGAYTDIKEHFAIEKPTSQDLALGSQLLNNHLVRIKKTDYFSYAYEKHATNAAHYADTAELESIINHNSCLYTTATECKKILENKAAFPVTNDNYTTAEGINITVRSQLDQEEIQKCLDLFIDKAKKII